ncbi:MAG: pro-sigmaK processing inhibitor BofA family protein [Bacillota bacterium]
MVFAFLFGLLLLYVVVRLLYLPLRGLLLVLYNGLIGGAALWLINLVGSYVGLHIAINPLTALIAGLLGLPGVVVLAIVQHLTH